MKNMIKSPYNKGIQDTYRHLPQEEDAISQIIIIVMALKYYHMNFGRIDSKMMLSRSGQITQVQEIDNHICNFILWFLSSFLLFFSQNQFVTHKVNSRNAFTSLQSFYSSLRPNYSTLAP